MTARAEELKALTRSQPVTTLALALAELSAKTEPDEAERLTHAVIMDVICEKSPAASAVFDALAESLLESREFDALVIAAALEEEAARPPGGA